MASLWAIGASGHVWSAPWHVPIVLGLVGTVAVPFVALGLAAFGLPASWLFERWRRQLWFAPVAAGLGGLIGKLCLWTVNFVSLGDVRAFWELRPYDYGVFVGVPTALAWWWLTRGEEPENEADRLERTFA